MSKYLKITLIFFGVWFIASLLNGLLSGISIAVLDSSSGNEAMQNFSLAVLLSFVLGAPATGLVWFATVIARMADKKGDELFQFVLGTVLICSLAAALGFVLMLGAMFNHAKYIAAAGIVVSALAAVLLFRKQIKTNE